MVREAQSVKWALGITILIILYLTLYPFDFSPQMRRFFDFGPPTLTDMVSNIFLFVPFGLFLGAWLSSKPFPWRFFLVIIGALLLSGLVELLQCHLPRNPSVADIFFNVFGAGVGCLFSPLAYSFLGYSQKDGLFLLTTTFLYLQPFNFGFNLHKVESFFKSFPLAFKGHCIAWDVLSLPAFVLALWAVQTKRSGKILFLAWLILEAGRLFLLRTPVSPLESILRALLVASFYLLLRRFPQGSFWLFSLAYLASILPPLKIHLPQGLKLSHALFWPRFSLATALQILSLCLLFALWPFLKPRRGLLSLFVFVFICFVMRILFSKSSPQFTDLLFAPLGAWMGTKLFSLRPHYDLSGSS